MGSTEKPDLYALLSSLRPKDMREAEWAREAQVNSSFFQSIKKGVTPRIDTLERVLAVIGVTPSEFYAMDGQAVPVLSTARQVAARNVVDQPHIAETQAPFSGRAFHKDVPIYGTAQGADIRLGEKGAVTDIQPTMIEPADIVDYAFRPPGLQARKHVYALYVQGMSMEPRWSPGDLIYVDPRRPPSIGDDVIAQLVDPADDQVITGLIKRLTWRDHEWIELRQFSPDQHFRIETTRISALHRVIPWAEVVGI